VQFPRWSMPALPKLSLTDAEQQIIQTLQAKAVVGRREMELSEAYYLGEQVIENLRIAVPQELEFLRTIVGWAAMAVDPYVPRLSIDCFRVPTATDADQHVMDLLEANGFAAELPLAVTDALSMGRSFWSVGTNPSGGAPLATVESPLSTTVQWDLRGLSPVAAMQEYHSNGRNHAALILPGRTIHLAVNDSGAWEIAGRNDHGFDFVPVVRMPHKPRTRNRDGSSAITPAMRSMVDMACRSLLGLEVAREIYSVPQKAVLGAAEDAFVKSDGTPKSAWDTYITKVLAMERDENGDLPELKQLEAYDPATFTKLLDWYASSMSGMVLAPPQNMGLYTQGNPASADSVIAMNAERDLNAIGMQPTFGAELVRVVQMMIRFENKGRLPAEFERLTADWNPVTLPNIAATSDAMVKQISAGAVPPTSDVTLKRLGYSAVERARLALDRDEMARAERRAAGREAASRIAGLTPKTPEPVNGNANGL
jgi:hypothetical protein